MWHLQNVNLFSSACVLLIFCLQINVSKGFWRPLLPHGKIFKQIRLNPFDNYDEYDTPFYNAVGVILLSSKEEMPLGYPIIESSQNKNILPRENLPPLNQGGFKSWSRLRQPEKRTGYNNDNTSENMENIMDKTGEIVMLPIKRNPFVNENDWNRSFGKRRYNKAWFSSKDKRRFNKAWFSSNEIIKPRSIPNSSTRDEQPEDEYQLSKSLCKIKPKRKSKWIPPSLSQNEKYRNWFHPRPFIQKKWLPILYRNNPVEINPAERLRWRFPFLVGKARKSKTRPKKKLLPLLRL